MSPEARDRRKRRFDIVDEVKPGRRYPHYLRREHEWVCSRDRSRWMHESLPYDRCGGMRFRPPRSSPCHQSL
jgi:hypothetical protein